VTSCVTNFVQYTCPSYCVFSAILIRGIKYQHPYDRTTSSTWTVGTKYNNTPQQRLHVARTSRICTSHNTGTRFQQECTHFTKIVKTLHNYGKQKGDKKQITYQGSTNIKSHCTKFNRPGVLATWRPGFVHLQAISIHWHVFMSIMTPSRPSNRWICLHGILYKIYSSWRPADRELCTFRLSVFTDTSSCQSRVQADRRTEEYVCTEFGYFVSVLKAINWRRQLHSSHHLIIALILRCIRKIAETWLLASLCLSVHQSVRVEQLGSHWTDCHEIWHLAGIPTRGLLNTKHESLLSNHKSQWNAYNLQVTAIKTDILPMFTS
jgi:hypothetical protein